LRHRILRPGKPLESCFLLHDEDPQTVHFAAFAGEEVVGILSVYAKPFPRHENEPAWQLRAMAVSPQVQGQGVGRRLLQAAENHVQQNGSSSLWCNARTVAVGFYLKCGFAAQGEDFEIPGVGLHRQMIKYLY
jgi:GNAT superfamily N-acetyltransferase